MKHQALFPSKDKSKKKKKTIKVSSAAIFAWHFKGIVNISMTLKEDFTVLFMDKLSGDATLPFSFLPLFIIGDQCLPYQ